MRKTRLDEIDAVIGSRLRDARESILGLAQKACAAQIGLERSTLANYEACRTPLRFEVALRFCRQFIISEEWLATGRHKAFHQALEERGTKGPFDDEAFDGPVSRRQCMDLWSDPATRHIREGTLFSEAYRTVLAPRYAELVRKFTHHQLIQLSDADHWETAVNYLKALHERHIILLNNEARNQGAREPLYWRTYTRRIYEAAVDTIRNLMTMPPADWEKTSTTPNLPLQAVTAYGNSEAVLPALPNLLARLNAVTEEHGKKSELAAFLGATLPSVSVWLSGKREPGGDTALRMLEWVQAAEATQQKSPASAETATGPKTRTKKIKSNETLKSSPQKE